MFIACTFFPCSSPQEVFPAVVLQSVQQQAVRHRDVQRELLVLAWDIRGESDLIDSDVSGFQPPLPALNGWQVKWMAASASGHGTESFPGPSLAV